MNSLLKHWRNFSKVDQVIICIACFAVIAIAAELGQHIHFDG